MRRAASTIALAAWGAGLAGCGAPPAGTSLFPLEPGHRWTYAVTTEYENATFERETLVLSTEGREPVDGVPAWRRRSASGVDYWLRADDSGIYRVASKSDLDPAPKPDAMRRYVLKAPYTAGTNWTNTTTAYLLKRRQEFPREIRHTHPAVPMQYAIEATGESVRTPAGAFDGCLRVKGIAVLRLFADPVVGWRDLPLVTIEWYCPGVGLVRLERHEPAGSTFLAGGSLTMELTSWH